MPEPAAARTCPSSSFALFEKLDRLRLDLVELAFAMDRQGNRDAADVAMTTSARIGELCAELARDGAPPGGGERPAFENA